MVDMEEFKNAMRKRFSTQHRGKNIIGSIVLNEIKSYFNIIDSKSEEEQQLISGYIRNNIFFIKTSEQQLKIQIFQQKNKILGKINEKLSKIGYTIQIIDIRFK